MSAFSAAVAALRRRGLDVRPSDVAGLTWVDGRELTVGQVVSLAASVPAPEGAPGS